MSAQARYCLDSNGLMTISRGPYAFDIAPSFWKWLVGQWESGVVYSTSLVYDEITRGGDALSSWAKELKDSGFFVVPSEPVQRKLGEVAQYVSDSYRIHKAQPFLDGADPWVIAQCAIDGTKLVTFETRVDSSSQKPKIPNIAARFQVECVTTYTMLRELGARF